MISKVKLVKLALYTVVITDDNTECCNSPK